MFLSRREGGGGVRVCDEVCCVRMVFAFGTNDKMYIIYSRALKTGASAFTFAAITRFKSGGECEPPPQTHTPFESRGGGRRAHAHKTAILLSLCSRCDLYVYSRYALVV